VNFPHFFATRLTLQGGTASGAGRFGQLGVALAVISVALGVAVMEISLSVATGFEQAIQRKLTGFAADVNLGPYLPWGDEELRPLHSRAPYLDSLQAYVPGIVSIAPYITRAGILQSKTTLEGVVVKGVNAAWNSRLFQERLEGTLPPFGADTTTRDVLISRRLANTLAVEVGSRVRLFFLQQRVRARPVRISGIYETGLTEFDQAMLFADLRMLQQIQGWDSLSVMGFEATLAAPLPQPEMEARLQALNETLPPEVKARSVYELFPDIFSWLGLQHQNVIFVIFLMALVAIINMASAVLIQITERTRTIGLLRVIGARRTTVRGIFLWNAFYLVSLGILLGNFLGLGLLLVQQLTGWVQLDDESYFVRQVPVAWVWVEFVWVNVGTVATCILAMVLPTWAANRILPARALRS